MESSALVYVGLTVVTVFLAMFVQSFRCVPCGSRAYARSYVAETAIFCLLAGVSACRIAVGNDYWVYRFNFRLIAQERHVSSEFGFNLIVKWMQELFGYDNYLPIFALFSLLTVWFFIRAMHGQAVDYAFSLFLLMTGGYYFNSLNTVRYYLALAIALYAMQYVLRGEYGKFLFWILFGCIFHKSILLVIPVYLAAHGLAKVRLKKWHYILGGALVASLICCQKFYREIVFYFYPYYRNSDFDTGSISWINIAKCVGTLVLCVLCYQTGLTTEVQGDVEGNAESDAKYGTGNERNRFYFFLNVAGLVVYPCGAFIPEVSRVGYYMIISQIFLIPSLLRDMRQGWFRKLCYAGVVGAFTLYFVFMLKGMYATDIRLLPYLNWIFD
jgi:hypothetical protein